MYVYLANMVKSCPALESLVIDSNGTDVGDLGVVEFLENGVGKAKKLQYVRCFLRYCSVTEKSIEAAQEALQM